MRETVKAQPCAPDLRRLRALGFTATLCTKTPEWVLAADYGMLAELGFRYVASLAKAAHYQH